MQILWKFIETCLLQGLIFFSEMIAKEEIAEGDFRRAEKCQKADCIL